MAEHRLLITGFEPFADIQENPSEQLGRMVADDRQAIFRLLPVDCVNAPKILKRELFDVRPSFVLCLGASRQLSEATIGIERVALNLLDFSIADNTGARPQDQPIVSGGPPALFCHLPIRQTVEFLQNKGYQAHVSLSAGAYLCNQVMYYCLLWENGFSMQSAFIHVPVQPKARLKNTAEAIHACLDLWLDKGPALEDLR